jgi:hypothetical protein
MSGAGLADKFLGCDDESGFEIAVMIGSATGEGMHGGKKRGTNNLDSVQFEIYPYLDTD